MGHFGLNDQSHVTIWVLTCQGFGYPKDQNVSNFHIFKGVKILGRANVGTSNCEIFGLGNPRGLAMEVFSFGTSSLCYVSWKLKPLLEMFHSFIYEWKNPLLCFITGGYTKDVMTFTLLRNHTHRTAPDRSGRFLAPQRRQIRGITL